MRMSAYGRKQPSRLSLNGSFRMAALEKKADVRRAIRLTLHLEGTRRYHVLRTAWGEIQ
jgi:hypothetical protein